jgi:hypothetical protein
VILQTGNPDKQGPMRSSRGSGRPPRVSAERLTELARHATERDREIAPCLFEQQLLATGQLTLLFFSSRRRAQDRLLFLARSLLPALALRRWQAAGHWLLDEPGAHLVAAMLGVERERLGWQRRRRLGLPPAAGASAGGQPFVTDLIAATLSDTTMAVTAWSGPRAAAEWLEQRVRPDGRLLLQTAAAP